MSRSFDFQTDPGRGRLVARRIRSKLRRKLLRSESRRKRLELIKEFPDLNSKEKDLIKKLDLSALENRKSRSANPTLQ